MDLMESVRQWVLRALPYDRSNIPLDQHLKHLDARGLLIVYYNWMSRLIRPQPRTVRKSTAIENNQVFRDRASEFAAIIDDVESGRDLRKYLTRGVEIAAEVPGARLGRRRDLDLMLNDWGIHHLHISTQVEADGYVRCDGSLLFAVFRATTAYLIDVMHHGDWTRKHVI